MNIHFKDGVRPDNLQQIMFRAIFEIAEIYNKRRLELTITSTDEIVKGRKKDSLHYEGLAIDIRIWRLTDNLLMRIFREIEETLKDISKYFQVVLKIDHIHIEYDAR